ncbi:MAG: O-antigen ligase family protein [Acetobacter orientalis]|uniref:O-antigen ligase family protein n=1 Tax=Acetobacter orientalis TaxID=146474 RepID=UPI0039E8DD15
MLRTATALRHISVLLKALTLSATICILLLPLFMFFSRALSDIAASVVGALFLVYCGLTQQWQWLRKPWVLPAALFCALCLFASYIQHNTAAILQAICLPRLFLLTAAVQNWVLTRNNKRLLLGGVFFALALWLMGQCWQQYFTGYNLLGALRWPDGSLTGPFIKPRAGFTLLMLFFPGIMPVVLYALRNKALSLRFAGGLLLLLSVLTMVLIGQRMSTVLMLFGLFLTALFIKQFRVPFLALIGFLVAAVASLPFVSPPVYAKLVVKFTNQLQHFSSSDYATLFKKAGIMVLNHPIIGEGMDGFRNFCSLSLHSSAPTLLGLPALSSPAGIGCNLHPHNYYLQVATTAGLPGLALFCLVVFLWLQAGAKHLAPTQHPQHIMLFVMCCTVLWPVTSTSSLFTFPTAGWVFLFAGWLMAASTANAQAPKTAEE